MLKTEGGVTITKYLLRRGFNGLIIIMLSTMFLHFFISTIPSDEARLYMRLGDQEVTSEYYEKVMEKFGFNKPWHERYWMWLKRAVKGDFGISLQHQKPAMEVVGKHLWKSLLLNFSGLIVMLLISIPIGIRTAQKKNSIFDHTMTWVAIIGTSIPTFYFGLLMIFKVATQFQLPISGMHDVLYLAKGYPSQMAEWLDVARHMFLPVMTVAITGSFGVIPYVRNAVGDVLDQDYIRTAKSKGLKERTVLYKHAMRNAMIPMISLVAIMLPGMFIGNIFIEAIFAWPGIGSLFIEALYWYSSNLILSCAVFFSVVTVFGNILADILYAVFDPKLRVEVGL